MSKFYLLNTVKLGSNIFKSGSLIDEATHPKAAIDSTGALCVPYTNATVAAAALVVQSMWREGKDSSACDAVMALAYSRSVELGDAAHDTVAAGTTRRNASWSLGLPAKGVAVHAVDNGGGALALVAGFTNPLPRRTLNIARSDAGPANVTYTLTVKTPDGGTVQVPLVVAKNANATTAIAGEWLGISTTVDPVSTSTFTTGDGFCVGTLMTGTKLLSCSGVVEAIVSSDDGSGTIVPTTAPNGVKEFTVQFSEAHGHALT